MTAQASYPNEVAPSGPAADFAADLRTRIPVLETDRLILRAPMIEDFQPFSQIMLSDRAAFLVEDTATYTRDDAWFEFTHCLAGWLLRGHGMWTLTDRQTGRVLGFALIHMEPGDQEPELGWLLTDAAEGQGFAVEAAAAIRDHAIAVMGLPSLVSYIDHGNARSVALAKRLNARRDRRAEAEIGVPVYVYRHHPAPAEAIR